MARCYKTCKHNWCNAYCKKYEELIRTSRHPAHYGLLLHPLDYLSTYYHTYINNDISHLIEIADKFAEDDTSKSIVAWYKKIGDISYKQRKYLVTNLLNCYEDKERG